MKNQMILNSMKFREKNLKISYSHCYFAPGTSGDYDGIL